jgi:hypothetical protein
VLPFYSDLLTAKVQTSPLAAGLGDKALAALQAVVCSPLCFSFVHRPQKAERPEFLAILRKIGTPRLLATLWLRGLVENGHAEDTLRELESDGLLQNWDLHGGLAMSLTPWSAHALGVELVELLDVDPVVSRWRVTWPTQDLKIRRRSFDFTKDAILLSLINGAPGPVENAMAAERWTRGRKAVLDEWSERPLLVAGQFPIMMATIQRPRKVGKKKSKRARQHCGTITAGCLK